MSQDPSLGSTGWYLDVRNLPDTIEPVIEPMKTHYLNTIFTKHAINRLYNRGITQADAWYAFQHPDGSLPGKAPGSRKFYKDSGSQRIEVIARQNDKREWVVLSCWSKQKGTGKSIFPTKETFLEAIIGKVLAKLTLKEQKKSST